MCEYLSPSNPEAKCPLKQGGDGGDGGSGGGGDGGDGGSGGGDGGDGGSGGDGGDGGSGGGDGGPVTISDPTKEFEDIWKKPSHDVNEPSRTLYQVDRSLDYIEKKLTEIHAIFKAKGLISS